MVRLDGLRRPQARRSSRADSDSVSRSRARSSTGRRRCCSTSRSAPSTSSCARSCRSSSSSIQQELGMTFVYVTHDQEEALTMCDRIAVFNQGQSSRSAPPLRCTSTRDASSWPASSACRTCSSATGATLHRAARRRSACSPRDGDRGRARGRIARRPSTCGAVDALRRRARRRRRAGGGAAEPRDVVEHVRAMEGKRVRLAWSPDVEFVIKRRESEKRIRGRHVALVALVVALVVPALGVSKTRRRPADVDRPGRGQADDGRLGGLHRQVRGWRPSRSRPAAR